MIERRAWRTFGAVLALVAIATPLALTFALSGRGLVVPLGHERHQHWHIQIGAETVGSAPRADASLSAMSESVTTSGEFATVGVAVPGVLPVLTVLLVSFVVLWLVTLTRPMPLLVLVPSRDPPPRRFSLTLA